MVDFTNGNKRALDAGAENESVQKKAKHYSVDLQEKEEFLNKYPGSCWMFAKIGKTCKFGARCRDDHVSLLGVMMKKSTYIETEEELAHRVKIESAASVGEEEFLEKYPGSCWRFAKRGKRCRYGFRCRNDHVSILGRMVQKSTYVKPLKKPKTTQTEKTPTKPQQKEREVDDATYSGVLRWHKKNIRYGKIFIEDDITFKGLTAKSEIYVRKQDIVVGTEEGEENKNPGVIFKVYKDSNGLGAMDVRNKDGSPILFSGDFKKMFEDNITRKKKKTRGRAKSKSKELKEKDVNSGTAIKPKRISNKLRKERALEALERLESKAEN